MSGNYPYGKHPHGGPPPYSGHPPHYPPHYPPHSYPPPPHHDGGHPPPAPYPYYMPGAIMMPIPMAPMPPPQTTEPPPQPTYVTNYIYHGEVSNTGTPAEVGGQLLEFGDYDWVPSTATSAHHLTGKAVIGGREGWDGSPLWVIRAFHEGELIPGKLSIRHNSASVPHGMKEVHVQNIEVLIAKPDGLRWIPASNGNIPPGAIPGGKTGSGECLYVGRANYQLSITPGKIHPSHGCCYIAFAGSEVSLKSYEVLCKI